MAKPYSIDHSRALAVHARTLELYEQLDLADAVVAKGYTVPGFHLWLGGREAALPT
jgi:2-polyprenyl-6-methoxyphenol hydroxylase-like FAD-dependent oxidoreductase